MTREPHAMPPPNWQQAGGPPPGQPVQQPPMYPNHPAAHPQAYVQYPPGYQQQYPPTQQGYYLPGYQRQPYAAPRSASGGRMAAGIILLVWGTLFGLAGLLQVPKVINDLADDPARALGRAFGIFLFAGLPFISGLILLVRRPH